MLHIVFWEPEIPGNTGAAIRLSACTGSVLHLVRPLGFDMDDAKLRRAGLDYHDLAHVRVHDSLDGALAGVPGRVWALTGRAERAYTDVAYGDGDERVWMGVDGSISADEEIDGARIIVEGEDR